MTTWQDALNKAANTRSWAVGMCDNFVANMWGQSYSGYYTAVDNWNASPDKHTDNSIAPAGALYYWGGGAGHVAISAGGGDVYSTDIGGPGTVTKVKATEITSKWNKPYLGWAPPYFNGASPGQVGPTTGGSLTGGTVNPGTTNTNNGGILSWPGDIVDFFSGATNDLTTAVHAFSFFFQPSTYVRIGAGLVGLLLIVAAGLFLVREVNNG